MYVQWVSVLLSSINLPTLGIVQLFFFYLYLSESKNLVFHFIWLCFLLTTNEIRFKHIFIYIIGFLISFSKKYLFIGFAHFLFLLFPLFLRRSEVFFLLIIGGIFFRIPIFLCYMCSKYFSHIAVCVVAFCIYLYKNKS